MSIKLGIVVDERYRITARIGHGGMAEVYEATDVITKKRCAMKFIKEDLMNDALNVKRFKNEAITAANLKHPNIVAIYNTGEYESRPYIAFEYVNGQSLKEVLDFRTRLPIEEALSILLQLTDALSCAHKHGVIHRDIKPDNIFYLTDGSIKLGDFGISQSQALTDNYTNPNFVIGSVHYMSPELVQGTKATVQSDIYAIGVTMFELLTGHTPFEKNKKVDICVAQVKEKFPSIKKFLPNCPKEIERIVYKATAKSPKDRYQTSDEMHADLLAVKNNPKLFKEKKGILSRIFGFK